MAQSCVLCKRITSESYSNFLAVTVSTPKLDVYKRSCRIVKAQRFHQPLASPTLHWRIVHRTLQHSNYGQKSVSMSKPREKPAEVAACFGCFLPWLLDPEDGGDILLRNFSVSPNYMALQLINMCIRLTPLPRACQPACVSFCFAVYKHALTTEYMRYNVIHHILKMEAVYLFETLVPIYHSVITRRSSI
jgi:hypothetical protein